MRMSFPPKIDAIRALPFYLVGVGLDHPQEPIDRPAGYPEFQWIRTLRGEGTLRIGSSEERVGEGEGMFLQPGEAHAEGRFMDLGAAYRASSLVYELLLALLQFCGQGAAASGESGRLRLAPALEWLQGHYAEPVDLAGLAELTGVTPQHLSRLFRSRFGLAPSEYLIRLRLGAAKDLLLSRPELRISEAARLVGYADPNYFARLFRSREGVGPGGFRKDHGY